MKGKIKKIVSGRCFGYIVSEDGREFFFHYDFPDRERFETMRPGDEVEFETDEFRGPRTPRASIATNVRCVRGRRPAPPS